VIIDLPHGHIWTFEEVDAFVDSILRRAAPFPTLGQMKIKKDRATAPVTSPSKIKEACLHYTTDTGEWQKRHWQKVPAEPNGSKISAALPPQRPLVCFLSVIDDHGWRLSTEYEELNDIPSTAGQN